MVKRKVPSQASSGAETFNDFLVGRQITDGTSALTNTVFSLDKLIPQKDSKTFKTNPFSEFLTLESLNEENSSNVTQQKKKKNEIKFRSNKKYADKSLFGSLKSRILVSITKIIKHFPASFSIDQNNPIGRTPFNIYDISYDDSTNITTFFIERSKLFNPFEIELSRDIPQLNNNDLRNFTTSFKKYILEVEKKQFPINDYVEPNNSNSIEIKVFGKPFNNSTYSGNVLIRPNDGIVEEFFLNLDDLESSLLNRESNPPFTSSFKVPKDNLDGSKTSLVDVTLTWPISSDNYNIQILGIDFDSYVTSLKDLADEIDLYKSNLMVRFLSSPQLFEFDTEDKRAESVFQLYGQSFDKVKKYIDNIAHMRNVSYDKINNVPDVLLKNLAENLGLSTTTLFDQKKLDEILYSRIEPNYGGISIGENLIESEYEFYRRLLVNLSYIFKSKGTKSSINFFLKFLGAPDPLIKIEEYIYKVTSMPSSFDLQKDIYDVIQGNKVFNYAIYNETTSNYEQVSYTASTTYDREGYPVDELTNLPRRAYNKTEDVFFQKGAGWYDQTLNHRSSLILDEENSILSGRTKTIVTKNKPYTYGEDYFNQFRTLPGLDTGFGLQMVIDNDKGQQIEDDSLLILNRKNIGIYISPSRAIDYDIYRKTRELGISFGSNTLTPQTGKTFAEFLDTFIHKTVKNSNKIRYKKNYIQLEDVYRDYYSGSHGFRPYNQIDVNEFIDRISPFWVQIIEQIIPATTLWNGGNLIENNVFGRSKFQYKYDCQPVEFIEDVFPDLENVIYGDLINVIGDVSNFRSLLSLTGITFFPIIEIDGRVYGGPDYGDLTDSMFVTVSGTTTTSNSAKLFNDHVITGCSTNTNAENLSLICDYRDYLSPDVEKIKELWVDSLIELIGSVKSNINGEPLINYNIYIDENGVLKVKFSSIKLGPYECSVKDYFDYRFESDYDIIKNNSEISVHVYGENTVFCDTPTGCSFVTDLYIDVIGDKTPIQKGDDVPFYVYVNCSNNGTSNNYVGNNYVGNYFDEIFVEQINECRYKITGFTEIDDVHFIITDASNKEVKFSINGLTPKILNDPCFQPNGKSHIEIFDILSYQGNDTNIISSFTKETYCDNYTGYTITPKIEYKSIFNHGLKFDSTVLILNEDLLINEQTTPDDIGNFINNGFIVTRSVEDLIVGDNILSAELVPFSQMSYQQILDANQSGDFSYIFKYKKLKIKSVDCLGSVRKSIITGETNSGNIEVFEVLPTTQLKVYTNKIVENFGVPINTSFFFDERYPEELSTKTGNDFNSCCSYPGDQYNNGDFLIDKFGRLIEVIDVDLNYCESNIYYNINFEINNQYVNPQKLIIFNGNGNQQVLMTHDYNLHDNTLFDIGQFYSDNLSCDVNPTNDDLSKNVFGC
jgi:hypothetical protein